MIGQIRSFVPETIKAAIRPIRSHWRQWRYGKKGVPVILCGESFRFKLGYEPITSIPGEFWEDDRLFLEVFEETVRIGQTVLDVGAFVGHYSLLAARRVGPGGRVIAIEPAPITRRILVEHLVLNELLDRVDVWPFAVGGSNGFAKIYFQKHDPVRGHNSTDTLTFQQKGLTVDLVYQTVPCVALGPFLKAIGIEPDVIKIDIEGAEIAALESISDILEGEAIVFCELHPQLWSEPDAYSSALQQIMDRTKRSVETLRGQPVSTFRHEPVVFKKIQGNPRLLLNMQGHRKTKGLDQRAIVK